MVLRSCSGGAAYWGTALGQTNSRPGKLLVVVVVVVVYGDDFDGFFLMLWGSPCRTAHQCTALGHTNSRQGQIVNVIDVVNVVD